MYIYIYVWKVMGNLPIHYTFVYIMGIHMDMYIYIIHIQSVL